MTKVTSLVVRPMKLADSTLAETRSEEVQNIINKVPGWLVRWGISLIFFVFSVLLFISWFIRYPDVIKAKVVVTTDPAPITLVARTSGKIILVKKENEAIHKGDLLAWFQTNTEPGTVQRIERSLSLYETNHSKSILFNALNTENAGELQIYLSNSLKALQDLAAFEENKLQEKQIAHLQKQVLSYSRLNRNLQKQLSLMKQETALNYQQYKADSLLLTQKVLAQLDFNKAKSAYLQQQRSLNSTEASILTNQVQVDGLEKQITEFEIDMGAKKDQLQTTAGNSIKELNGRIKSWRENYLFISPIDGTLSYLGFLQNEQFADGGKPLFAVIPVSNLVIAKAELPVAGAGKVNVGQAVNIRLHNYPYEQFGMLRGRIETISQMPEKETYTVTISLPEGMLSTYNKPLIFRPQLQGETEIITEDLRLLERVFIN